MGRHWDDALDGRRLSWRSRGGTRTPSGWRRSEPRYFRWNDAAMAGGGRLRTNGGGNRPSRIRRHHQVRRLTDVVSGAPRKVFTGKLKWVEFDTGIAPDDHNHLSAPEDRLLVAMAKQ